MNLPALTARRLRAAVTTTVSFLLAVAGLAFLPAPVAQAAQPAFACDEVYAVVGSSPHGIFRVNVLTGAETANGQFAQGASDTVNALAIGAGGGRYVYGFNRQTNRVLRYDATTESTTTYAQPANNNAGSVVAGAINPANGIYYYAASTAGTWIVYAFNTLTATSIGQVATITGAALNVNGDMAFDALGNLYLTTNSSTTASGTLARVTGTMPATAGNAALGVTALATTPGNAGQYTSIAIDSTGLLVIATSAGRILRVNASTGATVSSVTGALAMADLASCSVPSTGTVKVDLPSGRYAPTDQFTVTITGGGVTSGNTGTTTGTDSGLQDTAPEVGGAVITNRETTYTVTQTPASGSGTNLANYTTTWACVRQSDGSVLSQGTGSTGSYQAPSTAADVICTFTNTPLVPSIDLVKTASAVNDVDGNGPDAGDTVTFGYTVTNTGATPLSSVTVNDSVAGAVVCPQATLAIGQSMTCTSKTYALTQADVDAGQVVAPATAAGTSPTNAVVTDPASTTTPVARTARIDVDQTASAVADTNGSGKQDVGDLVTYGHTVTNTGNVTLTGVTVTDPRLGTITCAKATLAPGESTSCTPRTSALTQADVNAGSVTTTATATGTPPAGVTPSPVTDTDTTTVPVVRAPAIDLTLGAGPVTDTDGNGVDPGDTIAYTFTVRNNGNVPLDPVTVADPLLGAITCPAGPLAPGATTTCTTKSYAVTQADIDAGQVVNTATASGTAPGGAVVTDPDAVTTPLAQSPAVLTTKTASAIADTNASGRPDAGDRITYSFRVSNTGNVTLTSITVTDARVGTVTCPPGPLAPGATATCTAAAYPLTQADVDATRVVNTAVGSGTSPRGVTATDDDTVTTPVAQQPAVRLVKTAGPITDTDGNGPDAGDTVTYSFVVTNTGNTTLRSIGTNDTLLGPITCPGGDLAPGASITCTSKTYALTQADVNAGTVGSPATTSATSPAGTTVTSTSATTTPVPAAPRIAIDKTASAVADTNGNGQQDVGDRITYSFTVTNTGNVTLDPVTVTDQTVGAVTCPTAPLQPGQTIVCTDKSYPLTQADVNAGAVTGTATATGKPPVGADVTATDATSTPITRTPSIELVKTASPIADLDGNGIDAGDRITYSFSVTNTGNVPLDPVTVTDQTVGTVTCPPGPLAPGATVACTPKAYLLTQADVDAGVVAGTATATGTPPSGANVTDTDATSTPVAQTPSVRIDKTAGSITDLDGNGPDVGDTITYQFAITNTGNVTLSGVTVTDPKVGAVSCPAAPVAPGATVSCTPKTYTVTQDDVNAGRVDNTATVAATSPGGVRVTDSDTATSPITAGAAIEIDQTVTAIDDLDDNGPDAGDQVTYGYVVTNLGNVTLNGVTVTDPRFTGGAAVTCPSGPLAPGASVTCSSRTYPLTQADVDAGTVPGQATATGTPPNGPAVTDSDSVVTTVPARPAVLLDKTASAIADLDGNGPDAGDTVTYGFTVRNTGNVTLDPVTVTDTLLGPITCPAGPLAPGQTRVCTDRTYALTQADVDNGSVGSPATATGTPPVGAVVTSTDATTTTIPARPSILLDKTASPITDVDGNGPDAGDTITYGFTVTNTGNTTLTGLVVTDTLLGPVTCPTAPIAPGRTVTCTSTTYPLTQADVDAGTVGSPATATATPPAGPAVTSTDATTTPIAPAPRIGIDKTAGPVVDVDGNGPDAGDTVGYGFVVTNTGNVTLNPVTVSDTTVGAVTCPAGPLAPGASVTCTPRTYALTQADVDAGSVTGTATATGTAPGGAPVTATDTTSTPVAGTPGVQLVKTASGIDDVDGNGPDAGDQVTYTFTVTNTGGTTLTGVTVTDTLLGPVTCPAGPLAPGASRTCTQVTYPLTQADVDAGVVTSPATATGTDPSGREARDTDATTTPVPSRPSVELDLTAGPITDLDGNGPDAGDRITYGFVVTNTGNVTLTDVTVTDPVLGPITCPTGPLAPGASRTCTPKDGTLTQAEVTAGSVTRTSTAAGTAPDGTRVSDPDTVTTPVPSRPDVRLDLTAGPVTDLDGNGPDAGDTITYTYVVTNTGNVPLDPTTVGDPLAGPVTCPAGPLAPGESRTCTGAAYVVTQGDVDAGSVSNTSTATGTAPDGTRVSDPDTVTTPIAARPAIGLDKTAGPVVDVDGNGPDAGDTITYGFVVTNTGPRTLTDVTVVDDLLGAVVCPAGPLAPGASRTCTPKTYTVTQDDVEAGSVGSPATATGRAGDTTVTATDATATPIEAGPAVSIDKAAGALNDLNGNGPDAGDTVTYTFTVTNSGTVRLGQVRVADPKVGPVTCPPTTLAPGESLTCTPREYTLTQADVDAGRVENTATVRATTGPGAGSREVTGTDTVVVPVPEAPAVRVDLEAGPLVDLDDNGPDGGDRVDYAVRVTNTGNVTLDDVAVTDPELGPITCPRTTLAPGETVTCTVAPYTVTPAEAVAGTVETTATATGTSPRGTVVTDDDTETTPVPAQVTNVSIDKSVDRATAAPGATVRYTLRVTNDGPAVARDVVVEDRLPSGVQYVAADAPCVGTAGTVRCELGALAPGATRSLVVTALVREPATGAALVQHDLDIQKVEAQIDLEAGDVRTVTAQCAPGYLVTDGSGRVDAVDQGTGTLGSVRVVESYAADARTWTVTAVNGATGRAQAKVFAVCVKGETEQAGAGTAAGAHTHPLLVSAPVTRTVPVAVGRTEVTLDCAAGTVPVTPGYRLDGAATAGAVVTSYPAADVGWTFALESEAAGGTATVSIACLDTRTGGAEPGGGHAHDLDLTEVRRTVTVPAGQVLEVDLSCADDAKGIVAGWDLDPGLVNLGNDPRPKIRVFKLLNPTDADLDADLFLLCLAGRTRAGDTSGTIVNTARVSTSTPDTDAADDTDSATLTLAADTPPAPRPVATPAAPAVTVAPAGRAVTASVRCSAGTPSCAGTATLVATRTQQVAGRTVRRGTVLARAAYRVGSGRTAAVRLRATAAGARVLDAAALRRATLRVGTTSRVVTLRR